jgi:hypothetical protein
MQVTTSIEEMLYCHLQFREFARKLLSCNEAKTTTMAVDLGFE